jgi:hypothetical protein
MFKFATPTRPKVEPITPPTDPQDRREEFKVHVRFPGKRVLLGWSHHEGITLMALREPSVSEPVVMGKVFQTLEFDLDTPITEVWQGASVLVASHLS